MLLLAGFHAQEKMDYGAGKFAGKGCPGLG